MEARVYKRKRRIKQNRGWNFAKFIAACPVGKVPGTSFYARRLGKFVPRRGDTNDDCRRWPAVYFLVSGGKCLYVGQTSALPRRLRQHKNNGRDVSDVWFVPCPEHLLVKLESQILRCVQPQANIARPGSQQNRHGYQCVSQEARAASVCKRLGCSHLHELAEFSEEDVLELRGVGWRTLRFLKDELAKRGLALKGNFAAEFTDSQPFTFDGTKNQVQIT